MSPIICHCGQRATRIIQYNTMTSVNCEKHAPPNALHFSAIWLGTIIAGQDETCADHIVTVRSSADA